MSIRWDYQATIDFHSIPDQTFDLDLTLPNSTGKIIYLATSSLESGWKYLGNCWELLTWLDRVNPPKKSLFAIKQTFDGLPMAVITRLFKDSYTDEIISLRFKPPRDGAYNTQIDLQLHFPDTSARRNLAKDLTPIVFGDWLGAPTPTIGNFTDDDLATYVAPNIVDGQAIVYVNLDSAPVRVREIVATFDYQGAYLVISSIIIDGDVRITSTANPPIVDWQRVTESWTGEITTRQVGLEFSTTVGNPATIRLVELRVY